jgi:hypothetical protein
MASRNETRRFASPLIGFLALVGLGGASASEAAGVVGTGSAASCTEAALGAALAGGGNVTFNCGGGPVTIPITSTKVLTVTTSIDGAGQQVALDGGGTTRLFATTYQFSPFIITLRNLTLRNGFASDFGGAIRLVYQEPANWTTLNITSVTFANNTAGAAGNDVGGGAIHAVGGVMNIASCKNTVDVCPSAILNFYVSFFV